MELHLIYSSENKKRDVETFFLALSSVPASFIFYKKKQVMFSILGTGPNLYFSKSNNPSWYSLGEASEESSTSDGTAHRQTPLLAEQCPSALNTVGYL